MEKEENIKILKNQVDQDDKETGPLEQVEMKIIREKLTQKEMDG